MLEQLFQLLEQIEIEIGNGCWVNVSKRDECLDFRIYWPDGFRLSHRVSTIELKASEEEFFKLFLINKAKELHPSLAPVNE